MAGSVVSLRDVFIRLTSYNYLKAFTVIVSNSGI